MAETREKFATQVKAELLADLRGLARQEGRQLQALVEEAIQALLEQRRQSKARGHVMTAYRGSLSRYAAVYKKLAE